MSDLTPITREEALLDGQDLTPITRKELFIKRIYDKTTRIPEVKTREEWFLKKAGESIPDIDIEQLSVSRNGTYSESGKAYSPVIVEVPAPVLKTKTITDNGDYSASSDNADGYSSVNVNIPLGTKAITSNGTYDASSDDLKGYSQVNVNVPLSNFIKSATGAVASFTDGTDTPLNKLEVGIEAVQSGSGDPSPENIRPISGWDEANVTRCGKNLFDKNTSTDNEYVNQNGIVSGVGYAHSDYIRVKPLTGYYSNADTTGMIFFCVEYDKNKNFVARKQITTGAFVTNSETNYVIINTYKNLISIDDIYMIEGNSATPYESYNGHTYTIQLGDTYYGGTLDVGSGVLTKTHEYIASYNGETLPSTWISDRDVYASGTTPTTGAEVVYELATPTTIQLNPTQVRSLLGNNNIFADTGNVLECEYFGE